MTATLNAVVVPFAAAFFGQWGALVLAVSVTALVGIPLGARALAVRLFGRRGGSA